MIRLGGIIYRKAEDRDVFSLMRLYQLGKHPGVRDSVFLDHKTVLDAIRSPNSTWVLAEKGNHVLACFSILLDRENRLAKINRLYIDPEWDNWAQLLKDSLPLLIQYLKDEKRQIEVVYTTTRTFTLQQQEMTLQMGFNILGILPVSSGIDASRVNGLTAYYFQDVLTKKRHGEFLLHPIVKPFYELVRKSCGLGELPEAKQPDLSALSFETLPELELIYAPNFVARKFEALKERKSLAVHFYPFTIPNTLITDAEQRIEIYAKIMPDSRMATIIGERLDRSVNPIELYSRVSHLLNLQNIGYIEVINDAADVWGIEAFSAAGYLPCAYFPCLKNQGDMRRDYVVLARSFERPFAETLVPIEVNQTYLEFFREYYRLEGKNYLDKLKPH